MSSESGESQSRAQNGHADKIESVEEASHGKVGQDDNMEEGATIQRAAGEADGNQEVELASTGAEGFSFARTRMSFPQHLMDEDTGSELSIRPRVERPGSPESASTPDDTPSIQVCSFL